MDKFTAPLVTFARLVVLALVQSGTTVAQLAPNDPSIAAGLGVWLKDASTNFNPTNGIWTDSSGNERHATPVGEVNIADLRTFVAPVPSTTSGGQFSDNDLAAVKFSADIDDLLLVEEINDGTGLSDLTLIIVYNTDLLTGIPSQIRPIGIGSMSAQQTNPGDHFNLASDPSIRKDNGQFGANSYTQVFPNQTTFIRIARMSSTSNTIDEWFNEDGTLLKVLSVDGSSFTTSSDNFYLGDLRAGATGTPGSNGPNPALGDFDIVQAIAYTTALTDQQIEDLNEWLVKNPGGSGGNFGSSDLAFTNISISEDQASATLTWQSKPGREYAIDLSYNLMDGSWLELNDDIDSDGEETTASVPTYIGEVPANLPKNAYFRVRELSFN
ncbi:MAG: hypothetical protein ABF381_09670 [Akkermansiaceae bacterium]